VTVRERVRASGPAPHCPQVAQRPAVLGKGYRPGSSGQSRSGEKRACPLAATAGRAHASRDAEWVPACEMHLGCGRSARSSRGPSATHARDAPGTLNVCVTADSHLQEPLRDNTFSAKAGI